MCGDRTCQIRRRLLGGLAALALGIAPGAVTRAWAQVPPGNAGDALQVTLFAIVATPGSNAIDPKLTAIASQLRKLLPNHGFQLLDVQSKRLSPGESVRCDLGSGLTAATALVRPLDENGKVQLRCLLALNGTPQFDTLVATPPNQLFFCDRMRDDGSRLLLGVGAR